MYFIYSLALAVAALVTFPYFLVTGLRRGKYVGSFRARLGRVPPNVRSNGDALWLHAVSVGEVLACERLAAALKQRFPGRPLLVSTTTETGFRTAQQRLHADGFFFCPFDFSFSVKRVLDQVRPAALLVAETELWPNLFREAGRRGIAVIVVNARISDRSFPRYRRFGFFFRSVLRQVLLLAQSEEDARRLWELGAQHVLLTGNLKYDRPPVAPLPGWLDEQMKTWCAPGALIAGSTASGEEPAVVSAFARLRRRWPRLRMIVAPRRPERFDEVAKSVEAAGLSLARRSRISDAVALDDEAVLLLDTIGELAAFYRYATVAFVGGSLVPHGGQNFLEAAQFARPVVVGPYMNNFRDMTAAFRQAGALRQVTSADELASELEELFSNPEKAMRMGAAARDLLEASRGATGRVVQAVAETLPVEASKVQ